MKKYEYAVLIGRFNPAHTVHYYLIQKALEKADKLIILIGSDNKPRNTRNPFNSLERKKMISSMLSKEESSKVSFGYIKDYLYNENYWLANVQNKINELSNHSKNVCLVGFESDSTSYYLRSFPNIKYEPLDEYINGVHATKIRDLYFSGKDYSDHVTESVYEFLEKFKSTEEYKSLVKEKKYLDDYKKKWDKAPFKPIFVTVDSVVIMSGNVLVVKRGGKLGNGLLALPGGFVNEDEKLLDAAIRELKEETKISLSKEELRKYVKESKVFDHPLRSNRGRTISHAYLIDLGNGDIFPNVVGSDDAADAMFMPISDVLASEHMFFEDHYHIITHFMMKQ